MAEKTLFNFTNGFTGAVGDGSAPYTQTEFQDYNHAVIAGGKANGGVLSGIDNELLVTVTGGSPNTFNLATGRAQVYGLHYYNSTAQTGIALPSVPAVGDTGGIVVIRHNDTALNAPPNEDEGRVRVILNTDGTATIPSLTQTVGTTYDIPLASFVVDTSGNVWTDSSKTVAGVTDTRHFTIGAGSGMIKLREFVAAGGETLVTFDGIQQDLSHLQIHIQGAEATAVNELLVGMTMNNTSSTYTTFYTTTTSTGTVAATAGSGAFILGLISGSTAGALANDTIVATINNYTQSTNYHACVAQGTLYSTTRKLCHAVGWYTGTPAAITRLDFINNTWKAGSKITLYGLK